MDGDHTLARCGEVTEGVHEQFSTSFTYKGDAGGHHSEAQYGASRIDLPTQQTVDAVADATVTCLCGQSPPPFRGLRSCPAANPPIWPRPV